MIKKSLLIFIFFILSASTHMYAMDSIIKYCAASVATCCCCNIITTTAYALYVDAHQDYYIRRNNQNIQPTKKIAPIQSPEQMSMQRDFKEHLD